jgi:glycosyltransferase involved in cell wall biosynthesis
MQENAGQITGKRAVLFTNDMWSSALSEIRLKAPLQACGFAVEQGNDYDRLLVKDLSTVDFVVIQRDFPLYLDNFFHVLEQVREHNLPLVYEIDDNLFDLPADHPDQQRGCYSSRFAPMLAAISAANVVTTSTEPLAEFLRAFHSNVQVLPNCLIDEFWRMYPAQRKEEREEVVVGYIGGTTHAADLKMIAGALSSIGRQYGGKIKFKFFGARPPGEILGHPKVEWQPVIAAYREYAAAFQNQDMDILVAPLVDNSFSRAKSHVKFLEYSTLGAPGIYSNVTPYNGIVAHGENGFLASTTDEWIEYLQKLISSPDLRYRAGQNAQDTVRRGWLLSDRAGIWLETYNTALAGMTTPAYPANRNEALRKILSTQINQINRLLEREKHLAEMERLLNEKERALHEMLNSTSWKITDPLRRLTDGMRKIKNNLIRR